MSFKKLIRTSRFTIDTMPNAEPVAEQMLYELKYDNNRVWSCASDDYRAAMLELSEFVTSEEGRKMKSTQLFIDDHLAFTIVIYHSLSRGTTWSIKGYNKRTTTAVSGNEQAVLSGMIDETFMIPPYVALCDYTKLHIMNMTLAPMAFDISLDDNKWSMVILKYNHVYTHVDLDKTVKEMVDFIISGGHGNGRGYTFSLNGEQLLILESGIAYSARPHIAFMSRPDDKSEWNDLKAATGNHYEEIANAISDAYTLALESKKS